MFTTPSKSIFLIFFFFLICAKLFETILQQRKELLHVITGLINKGKQKQKPKWTEKLRIDWPCHFFYSSMGYAKL